MAHELHFGGAVFRAAGDAALYWPKHRALLVADLHLEKASSYAATSGQMLPPYDSRATLEKLAGLTRDFDVRQIICLGDNFHDDGGEMRLEQASATMLRDLTGQYDWHWIVGNHDPAMSAYWGGEASAEIILDDILLRHDAQRDAMRAEISGHYHPKIRIRQRGRHISRCCFLTVGNHLIMPAFGALTGGMDALAVAQIVDAEADAAAFVSLAGHLSEFRLETAC